ncbi:hypothetical protein ACFS07_03200 [Undibacterium arcticum]
MNLADRNSNLLTEQIDVLRNAMRKIRQSHPFDIIAMVVLPDHLHAIWRLPAGDADFSVALVVDQGGVFARDAKKNRGDTAQQKIEARKGNMAAPILGTSLEMTTI